MHHVLVFKLNLQTVVKPFVCFRREFISLKGILRHVKGEYQLKKVRELKPLTVS